jgi:adenosylhomocysteine nucleosidase
VTGPDGLGPASKVAVFAPMVTELRPLLKALHLTAVPLGHGVVHRGPLGQREIIASLAGIGTVAAGQAAERVLGAYAVDHVIVMGIAGGVDGGLTIGDLVVPESVVDSHSGAQYRPTPIGDQPSRGVLVTTDTLFGPDDVAGLRERGVVAVDMETSAIAAVCEAKGVSWSVFRSISDHVGDAIVDEAVLGMMRPDGSIDPWKVVRFLASRPGEIGRLMRLARGTKLSTTAAAAATLRACGTPA